MPDFNAEVVRRDMLYDGTRYRSRPPSHWVRVNRAVASNATPSLDVYDTIRCPLLFVGAERSGRRQFSRQAVEHVQRRHPALRTQWLDCGHDIFTERPQELARILVEFEAGI